MRKAILATAALIALASLAFQFPFPGNHNAHSGGGATPNYTGQNCTHGDTNSGTTEACTTTLTVSTGDLVVAVGSMGSSTSTLSSCSTSSGTATVSWSVFTAASNAHDTSNGESGAMCYGVVTSGGTVAPNMTWGVSGSDRSIVAAAFSGGLTTTDGGNNQFNTGSSATNGNTSNTFTTATNGDLLVGGTIDTAGAAATISAGTTSVTFTKIVCTTAWGGQTCIEWGVQTTAGAGTVAAWTYSNTDGNITSGGAFKP